MIKKMASRLQRNTCQAHQALHRLFTVCLQSVHTMCLHCYKMLQTVSQIRFEVMWRGKQPANQSRVCDSEFAAGKRIFAENLRHRWADCEEFPRLDRSSLLHGASSFEFLLSSRSKGCKVDSLVLKSYIAVLEIKCFVQAGLHIFWRSRALYSMTVFNGFSAFSAFRSCHSQRHARQRPQISDAKPEYCIWKDEATRPLVNVLSCSASCSILNHSNGNNAMF